MYLKSERQFWMGLTRLPEKRRPRVAPTRDPGPPQGGIFQDKLTDSPTGKGGTVAGTCASEVAWAWLQCPAPNRKERDCVFGKA